MGLFAVIDTETTWRDDVMSIGIAVADSETFELVDTRYYILLPYKNQGGMYSSALYLSNITPDFECSRGEAMKDLQHFLADYEIDTMFAYNAGFDYQHLPELSYLQWFDIMKIAAYRQHNPKIPAHADCFGTGRLKRGYGVESIYRMLSDDYEYYEMHNALTDAVDELKIMQMMGHELCTYDRACISKPYI